MRGEETQIFGALQLQPDLARGRHVLALPGTHTKWAVVESGRVAQFQTALTGELFALLRTHSTLLRTGGPVAAESFDATAFEQGVNEARSGALMQRLFQVRSRQLIEGATVEQATALLSGLLIGADVSSALTLLKPASATLICDPKLATLYAQALQIHGVPSQRLDGSDCALAALRAMAIDPQISGAT